MSEALGRSKPSAGVADGSPRVAYATLLPVSANRCRRLVSLGKINDAKVAPRESARSSQ